MTDGPVRLTRRRLLGSIATVGGASAASGAGTMALFSDSETSSDNQIRAGTLNLALDRKDESVGFLSAEDIEPGDNDVLSFPVKNTGTVPGYVTVEVSSFRNYENGLVGSEGSEDDSGGEPGSGNGELQDNLKVSAGFEDGPALWGGAEDAADALEEGTVYQPGLELSSEQSTTFRFAWVLPSDTGRIVQSDSVEFTLKFSLIQQTGSGS